MILWQLTLSSAMLRTLAIAAQGDMILDPRLYALLPNNLASTTHSLEREGLMTYEKCICKPMEHTRDQVQHKFKTKGRKHVFEPTQKDYWPSNWRLSTWVTS